MSAASGCLSKFYYGMYLFNKNNFNTKNYMFEPCSWRGVLDKTLCDKDYQGLAAGRWFSPGNPVSSTK